jgi:NADH:ubiquinone oxidoreductase subunit H
LKKLMSSFLENRVVNFVSLSISLITGPMEVIDFFGGHPKMSHAIWDFITSPYLHFVFVISVLVTIASFYFRYKAKEKEITSTTIHLTAISSVLSNMNEKLETLTKRPDSPTTRISILSPQEGETVNLITSVVVF